MLTVACAAAAPAAATTVRVKTFGSEDRTGEPRKRATVIVRAQGGERNRLRGVTTSGNKPQSVVIFDKAGVSPGRGCRRTSRRAVACRTGRFTVTDVDIVLGDRSDRATLDDFFPDGGVSVSAGRGDDRVISRSNFLGVYGGPGRDVLRSGGEAAFVGGPGDDRLFGGPGD
ncbi:MAG: hypothetical protein H0U25_04125, partial [Thermoleophilaceae bacterium]|nr:hypothetical protein [Thermoleophilaceae bacterium]